jgi:hypothetical protein
MGDRRPLPRAPLNRALRLITLTPTSPLIDAAFPRPRRRLRGRRRRIRRRDIAPAPFGPRPHLRCRGPALLALLPLRWRRFRATRSALLHGGVARGTRWRGAKATDFAPPQRLLPWRCALGPDGA